MPLTRCMQTDVQMNGRDVWIAVGRTGILLRIFWIGRRIVYFVHVHEKLQMRILIFDQYWVIFITEYLSYLKISSFIFTYEVLAFV